MDLKTKDNLVNSIIKDNRHQFIYGYNGKEREQLLKNVVKEYPVKLNSEEAIGIYLDSIGLPKINGSNGDLNESYLSMLCSNYLIYSIAKNLIDTTIEQLPEKVLGENLNDFLDKVNNRFVQKREIKSLQEFSNMLKEVRDGYLQLYRDHMKKGNLVLPYDKFSIQFINSGSLITLIRFYKQMINSKSHISVITDHQVPIDIRSQKAINTLMDTRLNADISIKVACEPNNWDSHYSLNDSFSEGVHDYETIELEDCYNTHNKKINKITFR